MKTIIKQYCLLVLLVSSSFAQEINFSKDSLNFNFVNNPTYMLSDSVVVKNIGDKNLFIDSIYSQNMYGYQLQANYKDSLYHLNIYSPSELLNLSIQANDSVTFIFYNPDLCPICSSTDYKPFHDSIIIHSNSKSSSYSYLYVSGYGYTSVENNSHLVSKYSLEQNYPNPFNPTTTISYEIKSPDYIELNVFNLLGEKVANLVKEYKMVGRYKILFNAASLSSGVYFYQLVTNNSILTKKMQFVK